MYNWILHLWNWRNNDYFGKAYSDTKLYENALKKVNTSQKVNQLLGQIEPLGKMAILEGQKVKREWI